MRRALKRFFASSVAGGMALTAAAATPVEAQQPELDAAEIKAAFDSKISEAITECTSGTKDVHRIYYVLVDQSTSIDSNEWDFMMTGLKAGFTDDSILSMFNKQQSFMQPRYLVAHLQFSDKAALVDISCIETEKEMRRFAANNFSGYKEEKTGDLGAYTRIYKGFELAENIHQSLHRLGWSAEGYKALLVADGKEQKNEIALREVLARIGKECIEVDTVAIVPEGGDVGDDDTPQELIAYLNTVHTQENSQCNVTFETADGRVMTYPQPLTPGTTYPAYGFQNVGPAVGKALSFTGG